ncbi:MAG: YdcF family protein [Acetobacter papayae]|uniref:YdcF family protein n=1 Tax=Acetobacter papayae TaxID=1076592 RepID=UPI0039EB75B6
MRRLVERAPAFVLLGLPLLFLCGFGWFVHDALRPAGPLPHTAGIVALTGGAGRVETSLRLLERGQAEWLLISGVAPQASQQALLLPEQEKALGPRITLGYQARSTIGNAEETAAWVADNHIGSLVVVTAGYHMRRAMLELGRTLPDVALYACPVTPPAMHHLTQLSTLRLLMTEYLKWLGALAGMAHKPIA